MRVGRLRPRRASLFAWRSTALLIAVAIMGLATAPLVLNAAEGDVLDEFSGSTLSPEWTFRDGYAEQFPSDTANHASVSVIDGHLSLAVPGGAEHNMWWLRHAEVQRAYEGSGVYEIRVNSDFTGYQQVGLSFESSPGTFMIFMLYSHDTVHGYVERFANVGGQQYKSTVAGASTGAWVPATGPWYIRVTVDDDANPTARTWHFQWSRDGFVWNTLTSGVLEGSDPTQNAGVIQKVGVFAGNQPEVFSAFDARIDYFSASATPLPPPPTAPVVLGSALDGGAQLSWDAIPGATGYRVYRSLGHGGTPTLVASPTQTQFTDSGLTNGQTYVYTVTSVVAANESDPSVPAVVVPNAPPPVPLSGLVLGLDASTLGLGDGTPVTSWAGYGASASGSGTSRPTLVASGIGGKPSVRFDGVNDYLGLGAGFEDFTSGATLFVVSRPSALQPGFKILALGNGAGQANVGLGRAGSTNGLQYWTTSSGGAYGWFDTSPVLTPGTAQLVSVRQPGGAANSSVTATLSVNGAPIGGGTVFVPPVTTRSVNYLGRSYWNEGWFSGDLSEVLVYNRALTTEEVATVTSYLASKYGLGGPAAPEAPTGLAATAGDASVGLAWNSVASATGYRVYRSSGGGAASALADVTTTAYTDTAVANGTTYSYTVRALGTGGESGPSNTVEAMPVAAPTPPPVPLSGLVLGLDASTLGLGDGTPVSSWAGYGSSASASGTSRPTLVTSGIGGKPSVRFDGVNDYLGLGAGFEDFTSGVTLFVVSRSSALQPGFKILALGNGAGQANVGLGRAGSTSGLQYWTTSSGGAYGWFDTSSVLTPGIAQLVSVRQPGGSVNSSVTATLSVNGAAIGGGTVFVPPVTTRSVNYLGRSYWNEGWFSGDLSEVLVYNRALTTEEVATVTGYLASKYGLGGPAAPEAPTGLTATAGDASVGLAWNSVASATGYRVYRSSGGGAASALADVTTTAYTDTSVANGTTYSYTVRALGAGGESGPSNTVEATPVAAPTPPPVPLSGLVLGLDASTLGLADGTPVTSWAGYGSSASASGTSRPTLVTSGIGGKPSVRFDGVNDYLGLGAGFEDFTSGVTLFVVSRSSALQPGFKILALGNGAGQANVGLGRAGSTNGLQYWTTSSGGAYGWFDTSPVLTPGTAQLVSVRQPGGSVNSSVTATLSVNGAAIGSGTVFVPPVTTRSVNYLGRSYWNEGWFSGDLSEVLVYNRALTTEEVATVTGYLASKYGLGQ